MINQEILFTNNLVLIFGILINIIIDLVLKRNKVFVKKKYIFLSFILTSAIITYYLSSTIQNNFFFHNLLITILLFMTYDFFLIGVFFESPTLIIIKKIYKSKSIKLAEIKKSFENEKFIKNRINLLLKECYLKKDKENFYYTKKNLLIIKLMKKIKEFLNIKDKMNG